MKKILTVSKCCCLAGFSLLSFFTPKSCLGSGYEFEGVGARQVSRAGAAIADSEDWTAVYWNPGNLVRAAQKTGREIGVEIFGGMSYAKDSNSINILPGAGFTTDHLSSPFVLGASGAVIPLGPKTALGFGVYTPLLQGANFEERSPTTNTFLDYEASAGIITGNVSLSQELLPSLSVGGGINILYGKLKSKSLVLDYSGFGGAGSRVFSDQSADGYGFEGVLGLRYDPHPKWSLGAVYRTGSDIPLYGRATLDSNTVPDEDSRFNFYLRHPATSGIGAAYRHGKKLTFSLDFTQTWWKRFRNSADYFTPAPGGLFSSVDGVNTFHWKNAWKIKLGGRYFLSEKTELLGGYSYDTYAIDAGSIDFSTAIDAPLHRVAAGIARKFKGNVEGILGAIVGTGSRTEGSVSYRLSGFQLMTELRYGF